VGNFQTWDDNPAGIKIFILASQSNMVGYGKSETGNGDVAGAIAQPALSCSNDASYPDYNYSFFFETPLAPTTSAWKTHSDVKV